MPIEIRLPALSPTMTEADMVQWYVNEGDTVAAGDLIAEVETDKAAVDIESPEAGTVARIVVPEGTQGVAVDAVIAVLEPAEETSCLDRSPTTAAALETECDVEPMSQPKLVRTGTTAPSKVMSQERGALSASQSNSVSSQPVNASPLARRMAAQLGLDLIQLCGSGPDGRITKADIEAAVAGNVFDLQPLSRMRKAIARRVSESKRTIPHIYLSVDCNVEGMTALREQFNDQPDAEYKLSLSHVIIKAAASALRKVPAANASWSDEGIKLHRSVDISVVVATHGGLITPVIRDADRKGLSAISAEMKELVARAREGKLRPEQYEGGTFTISNLGMYGIKQFEAVINPPQACVLAVGKAEQRPAVSAGTVVISTLMSCTLSADHRVLDGAAAAQFLSAFKQCLEEPRSCL